MKERVNKLHLFSITSILYSACDRVEDVSISPVLSLIYLPFEDNPACNFYYEDIIS